MRPGSSACMRSWMLSIRLTCSAAPSPMTTPQHSRGYDSAAWRSISSSVRRATTIVTLAVLAESPGHQKPLIAKAADDVVMYRLLRQRLGAT